jgi:hypothetical protein
MRYGYAPGGCEAEFVEVEIGDRAVQSVAVESADSSAVRSPIDVLAIGGYPNIGYVRQIKSILGRT